MLLHLCCLMLCAKNGPLGFQCTNYADFQPEQLLACQQYELLTLKTTQVSKIVSCHMHDSRRSKLHILLSRHVLRG